VHVNRPVTGLFTRKKAVRDRLPYFPYYKDTTFFDEKQEVLKRQAHSRPQLRRSREKMYFVRFFYKFLSFCLQGKNL